MPKISIIIPVFNCSEHIGSAINSILSQTFKNYEIIIVDDGSTDAIDHIIAQYSRQNIKYIKQLNKGPASARNTGIKAATGDFICFLDADDTLEKNSFSSRLAVFQKYPELGLVFTDLRKININNGQKQVIRKNDLMDSGFLDGIPKKFIRIYDRQTHIFAKDIWQELVIYCFIWTGAVMVPRKIFEAVGLFREDIRIAEDHDLWIRIARKYKIGFKAICTATYNFHSNNITKNIVLYYNCSILVRSLYLAAEYQLSSLYREKLKQQIAKFYFNIGYYYFGSHQHHLAKNEFIKSLRYNSFCMKYYLYLLLSLIPRNHIVMLRSIKKCILPDK